MIDIFLLEQLDAFARAGTLLRAAEELHITQPALSRNMKKLESDLGVSLFDRSSSKIALNETGKIAADYARRVLDADRAFIEQTVSFDRSRRTIVVGAYAPLPIQTLMPTLQEHFSDMAITTELADDERLLQGLRNRLYQLVILHERIEDDTVLCQRYLDERLYVTVPQDHPLSKRGEIFFSDLNGLSILAGGNTGFWLDICRREAPDANLLVQTSAEAMTELVEASSLPVFNSDRMIERGYQGPGRVSVPIMDEAALATYYLACLSAEQKRFAAVFNAVRSTVIRGAK